MSKKPPLQNQRFKWWEHVTKETGMNLNRYIRVFRMEKAKDLLCSTNMKVAQVSEKVGFANVSYFCRSFRDYYGSSPESYRKGTAEDEQTS